MLASKGLHTMKLFIFIKMYFIFIFFLIFISCSRDVTPLSVNDIVVDENYPTTLYSVSFDELQLMQNEFDLLNESKILTKLNSFGFTGKFDYTRQHTNPGIKINKTNAIKTAVSCLIKNNKFTNVKDSKVLMSSLTYSRDINDDSTCWKFRFGPQFYSKHEILYSLINVFVCGDGVYRIIGFWYPDIYIPTYVNFDIEKAKNVVIGEKIIWHGIGGEPYEFVVSEASIPENIVRSIFPIASNDSIELRITWKIPILFGSFIGWHIYLDTMTGEIIKIIQEFQT